MALDLELLCILIAHSSNPRIKTRWPSYVFSHVSEPLLEVQVSSCKFLHLLQHCAEPSRESLYDLIVIGVVVGVHIDDVCDKLRGGQDM